MFFLFPLNRYSYTLWELLNVFFQISWLIYNRFSLLFSWITIKIKIDWTSEEGGFTLHSLDVAPATHNNTTHHPQ